MIQHAIYKTIYVIWASCITKHCVIKTVLAVFQLCLIFLKIFAVVVITLN